MNTHQAEYESALDRLRADMALMKMDAATRDAELAKRDKVNIQWNIGLAVAMTTLIIGAIAIL